MFVHQIALYDKFIYTDIYEIMKESEHADQ